MDKRGKKVWGIHGNHKEQKPPYLGAKLFLAHSVAGIGWPLMGDLSTIDPVERSFCDRIGQVYGPEDPNDPTWTEKPRRRWIGRSASILFRFVHKVNVGDSIVLPTTNLDNKITIGVIESDYFFNDAFDKEYKNLRKARWLKSISRDTLSEETRNATNIQQ